MYNAGIVGFGVSLPSKKLTNEDLEKIVDTSDEWIMSRTGIKERRITDDNVFASDLSAEAGLNALKDANIQPEEVDLIIVATVTGDMGTPSVACIVQDTIGAVNAASLDINAACSGFVYGLSIAKQYIMTGEYKTILLIGTETLSKVTNWEDRSTCILFGDASGAVVIKAAHENGIIGTHLGANGALSRHITINYLKYTDEEKEKRNNRPGNSVWMNGQEVFKFASKTMVEACYKILDATGMKIEDIKLVIPHQANIRIIESAKKRLRIDDSKIFVNIEKYGNTGAASIPVALYESVLKGRAKSGDYVLLVGFGGGLTWGSAIVKIL